MAWNTILGQPMAVRMLQSHLVRQRIAPAYLFVGPDGVGKRLAALEMAKAVNCDHLLDGPCDTCGNCQRITREVHPDVHRLSPHGPSGSIPIEDVRQLLERVNLRPYVGKRTVAVIDGADRLTEEAANSLLKALEEPPGQTTFLLITAHPSRCLSTIISRCRVIRFQRLTVELIEALLARIHSAEPHIAQSASRLAQGSMARALELCAQWTHHETISTLLGADNVSAWLQWEMPKDREELSRWLGEAILWLRDVAVACVAARPGENEGRAGEPSFIHHRDALEAIREQARRVDPDRCAAAAFSLMELKTSLEEQSISPRLVGTLLRERWLDLLQHG